jgi:NADH dehydrogenase FAD-containing subunit
VVGAGPTGSRSSARLPSSRIACCPAITAGSTLDRRGLCSSRPARASWSFDERLQRYTTRTLERMGVEVRCATMATGSTRTASPSE